MFDFLIVGAGMFGSVCARVVAERGCRVLLIDQRDHIGGNCHSRQIEGIHIHWYGPHIFHTNSQRVWDFARRFSSFNDYVHRVMVNYRGRSFSFPINLKTFGQLWQVSTTAEVEERIVAERLARDSVDSMEDWILSQVGIEIYETFFKGYTTKQWGKSPRELPASIIKRIPIRFTDDDRYFDDRYQGIPIGGYTRWFENLINHPLIKLELNTDFFKHRSEFTQRAWKVIYSGKIDRLFDYRFGRLEYRSMQFDHQFRDGTFQQSATVNYTDQHVPYTRITEHKHFGHQRLGHTVITREYPQAHSEANVPCYPIPDHSNQIRLAKYEELARASEIILGGRLGQYRYLNMDQVIAAAIKAAEQALRQQPVRSSRAA